MPYGSECCLPPVGVRLDCNRGCATVGAPLAKRRFVRPVGAILAALATFAIGVGITLPSYTSSAASARATALDDFNDDASRAATAFAATLRTATSQAETAAAAISARSPAVDPTAVRRTLNAAIAAGTALGAAMTLSVFVADSDRAAFEALVSASVGLNRSILERTPTGAYIRAATRPMYLPFTVSAAADELTSAYAFFLLDSNTVAPRRPSIATAFALNASAALVIKLLAAGSPTIGITVPIFSTATFMAGLNSSTSTADSFTQGYQQSIAVAAGTALPARAGLVPFGALFAPISDAFALSALMAAVNVPSMRGIYIEDVTGLPGTPSSASLSPGSSAATSQAWGAGVYFAGGRIYSNFNGSSRTGAVLSPSASDMASFFSSSASSGATIVSFIIPALTRVWMVSAVSATNLNASADAAARSVLAVGLAASAAVSLAVLAALALWTLHYETVAAANAAAVQALRVENDTQQETMAVVAHELRNPLHVVSASAALLLESLTADDAANLKGEAEHIASSAEHMHRLLADMMNMSALRQGKLEVKHEVFELRPMIARLAGNHRSMLHAGVTLEWSVDAAVPRCMLSDPLRVQQTVINGLTNAIKFCRAGRVRMHVGVIPAVDDATVVLTIPAVMASRVPAHVGDGVPVHAQQLLAHALDMIELSISNTGPAPPARLLSSSATFTPFVTGPGGTGSFLTSRSTTAAGEEDGISSGASGTAADAAKSRGTGLGLSVARKMAVRLGGSVDLLRDDAGVDEPVTIYRLTLPLMPRAISHALIRLTSRPELPGVTASHAASISPASVVIAMPSTLTIRTPPHAAGVGGSSSTLLRDRWLESLAVSDTEEDAAALHDLVMMADAHVAALTAPCEQTLQGTFTAAAVLASIRAANSSTTAFSSAAAHDLLTGSQHDAVAAVAGARRRRVLYVDDDNLNRVLFQRMGARCGLDVVTASDGVEALELVLRANGDAVPPPAAFDAVFLDLNMDRMGGRDVCARVRAAKGGESIFLCAATAEDTSSDAALLAAGFNATLHKPFTLADVQRVVAALLP